MNNVNLIGRIASDLKLKYIPSGKAVMQFNLAVDRGYSKEKKLENDIAKKPNADFIPIVAWGVLADLLNTYCQKGSQLGVSGKIQTRHFTNKEGQSVYTTEVLAINVNFLGDKPKDDIDNTLIVPDTNDKDYMEEE